MSTRLANRQGRNVLSEFIRKDIRNESSADSGSLRLGGTCSVRSSFNLSQVNPVVIVSSSFNRNPPRRRVISTCDWRW